MLLGARDRGEENLKLLFGAFYDEKKERFVNLNRHVY